MNGLEIWSDSGKLVERWVLQDGIAVPEVLNSKDGAPLYSRIGVLPSEGSEYLKKLEEVVDNASYLVAKEI